MKIRLIADFDIPDNTSELELWEVTNDDDGYVHIKEEFSRALFTAAQTQHLCEAIDLMGDDRCHGWTEKDRKHVIDEHKMWAKVIENAKIKFEKI